MKTLSLLALLITSSAMAASDSVGVFYRPEKVVVLVNERGEEADLQNLIRRLGAGKNSFQAISQDKKLKLFAENQKSKRLAHLHSFQDQML